MPAATTKDRILDATAALLVRDGPQCSMSSIAGEAGVAIGSVYNHFDSKHALIHAVYDRLATQLDDAVVCDWENDVTAQSRLDTYIERYIDFFWSDPQRAVLFEILSSLPLVTTAELRAHFARSADYIAQVLGSLKDEGTLRDAEPGQMAGFIGGAIRNTLKWRRLRSSPLADKERAQIRLMCLAAIGTQ